MKLKNTESQPSISSASSCILTSTKQAEVNSTRINYSIDEEHRLICDKIKSSKTPNKKVILGTLCSSLHRNTFKYRDGTVTFTRHETLFMQEKVLNESTFSGQKQFFEYANDLIRRKFALVNNVCSITYTNSLQQFDVFSNVENITHPALEYKIPQVRGKQRDIAKMRLKDQKASKWRDIYLCKQSKDLRQVGQYAVTSGQEIMLRQMKCISFSLGIN
uniref:Uncharacterized protein n=1 Tax=Glossina austeni TaxID=7395 RepID=A0A1A9V6K4_GLOAU